MSLPVLLISLLGIAATSLISGVLGMAGGLLLMALLLSLLPVAMAMVVHGLVQALANGFRALLLLRHVCWRLLPPFCAGGLVVVGLFSLLALVPEKAWVLILMGSAPWAARLLPRHWRLDVTKPWVGVLSGMLVTSAQLLSGVAGPLLDMFYLHSNLNRYQIIASKAMTQTLGHLLKLGYYASLLGQLDALPGWFWPLAAGASLLGTWRGTRLLVGLNDAQFRRISGWVILGLGAGCVLTGLWQLLGA